MNGRTSLAVFALFPALRPVLPEAPGAPARRLDGEPRRHNARQLRMNESQLHHTLSGRRRLPPEFFARVAEILGVSAAELLVEEAA